MYKRQNPYLKDWKERLVIDEKQHWRDRWDDPQGVGIAEVPSCFTSVPLTVFWGAEETSMRLVGGLLGVIQEEDTLTVEPECGWAVIYEEPVDDLEERNRRMREEHHEWIDED